MAASYAAFGNNGVYTDPHSITKIVYRDGKTSKNYTPESKVAMNDYTAYMVTDMLRDVVGNKPDASGTAANVPGLDIAGKTGTTNYSAEDFSKYNLPNTSVPDSWFAGYTTNYSIAIWSGYEKHFDPITTWEERRLPQNLFKTIMQEISANVETASFKKPSTVVEATVEVGSKPLRLASEYTPSELRQTELFVRGTEPTEVSEVYEAPELSTPYNVSASLDLGAQSINISWEHDAILNPETDEPLPTSFEVSATRQGGETVILGTADTNGLTVANTLEDGNYTISVVAIVDGTRSEHSTTTFRSQVPLRKIWKPKIQMSQKLTYRSILVKRTIIIMAMVTTAITTIIMGMAMGMEITAMVETMAITMAISSQHLLPNLPTQMKKIKAQNKQRNTEKHFCFSVFLLGSEG